MVLGDSERPAELGSPGGGVGVGEISNRLGRHAGDGLGLGEGPLIDRLPVRVESDGSPIDEILIVQPGLR